MRRFVGSVGMGCIAVNDTKSLTHGFMCVLDAD